MTDRSFSGRCVIPAKALLVWLLTAGCMAAWAQEAPMPAVEPLPEPLPAEAEAPYQDLKSDRGRSLTLDEAIFTDISPLTAPEIGIALPEDQSH